MLKRLKNEKPWAKLRITRRHYEASRPWAAADMNRQRFEELILELPDDEIASLFREAEADRLVSAIFGKVED